MAIRQLSSITFIGLLALSVAGCVTESGVDPTAANSPSATPTPIPVPVVVKPAVKPGEPFTKPIVPPKAVGLIPSTNGDERVKIIKQGRADPFALIPVSLVTVPPPPGQVRQVPPVTTPPRSTLPPSRSGTLPTLPRGSQTPGVTPRGNTPTLTTLPPLPQPELARAVEVTGVVRVGSVTQIIVKAPNEDTSRYVSVGQRLSNGQVLVKRIELQGSEPVVVLEQFGIEVIKSIGRQGQPLASRSLSSTFS